jgi:Lon protease-like protein
VDAHPPRSSDDGGSEPLPPGTARLPLFPLGQPLLPGGELGLHIFEPRYRRFARHLFALPEDRQEFGVVALRSGREVGEDVADDLGALHLVGTVARVERTTAYEDGRFDVEAVGIRRFRLVGVTPGPGEPGSAEHGPRWALGLVEAVGEPLGDDAAELSITVTRLLARYCALLPAGVAAELDLPEPGAPFDPVAASYAVARAVVLSTGDRQALLECPSATTRLHLTRRLLRRELAVISEVPSLPVARADLPREAVSAN